MTVLCLVRHGETEWNATGKLQGRENINLNKMVNTKPKNAVCICAKIDGM